MPHGAPDWSNVVKYYQVHRLDDLAELAVRLGSITTYDRRGDVLWSDSFDYGLQAWRREPLGTGATISASCEFFRSHGFSAKLTAGSDDAALARIRRYFPLTVSGTHGVEASWTLHSQTKEVEIGIFVRDKGIETHFAVKYSLSEKKLYYINETGMWSVLDDAVDLIYMLFLFHTWKLVIDTMTGYYVRLLLDNKTYDLSNIKGHVTTPGGADYFHIVLVHYGIGGANPYIYLDDVILTRNEPV